MIVITITRKTTPNLLYDYIQNSTFKSRANSKYNSVGTEVGTYTTHIFENLSISKWRKNSVKKTL